MLCFLPKGIWADTSFTAPTFIKLWSSHWKDHISIPSLNNLNSVQLLSCQIFSKSPNTTKTITLPQLLGTKALCENIQVNWGVGQGWEVSLYSTYRKLITIWNCLELWQCGAALVRGNESLMLFSQIYIIQWTNCSQLSRPKGGRWVDPQKHCDKAGSTPSPRLSPLWWGQSGDLADTHQRKWWSGFCGSYHSLVTAKVQSNESNCIPQDPPKKERDTFSSTWIQPLRPVSSLPEMKLPGGKGRLNTSQEDSLTSPSRYRKATRRGNASSPPRQLPTAPGSLIHFQNSHATHSDYSFSSQTPNWTIPTGHRDKQRCRVLSFLPNSCKSKPDRWEVPGGPQGCPPALPQTSGKRKPVLLKGSSSLAAEPIDALRESPSVEWIHSLWALQDARESQGQRDGDRGGVLLTHREGVEGRQWERDKS